jgi:hypothetical protein
MRDRESMAGEPADSQTPTTVEKLRGLPWGVAWSVTNSVFAQYTFFGSIFVLFLNQLGLDKAQIGGLLSLLPFLGIIAVFIAGPLARAGHKRVFVLSMTARTATAILLLLAPWILVQFGQAAVLGFILVTVAVFALFRATGFTAFYPWLQEQVPDTVRGKYTAIKNALASLSAFLAVMAAGYVLGPDPDLGRFLILITVGVVFGLVSVWTATKIPGGAPARGQEAEESSYREMMVAARDRNLVCPAVHEGAGGAEFGSGGLAGHGRLDWRVGVELPLGLACRPLWQQAGHGLGCLFAAAGASGLAADAPTIHVEPVRGTGDCDCSGPV